MHDVLENKVRRRSDAFVTVQSQVSTTDPAPLGRLKLHGIFAIVAAIAHRPETEVCRSWLILRLVLLHVFSTTFTVRVRTVRLPE